LIEHNHHQSHNDPHSDHHGDNHGKGEHRQPDDRMHSNHDHGDHDAHSPEVFLKRFWLVFILTVPVLAYSHHIQSWFNFHPPHFPGADHIPFILGTVIFFYGGMVFLRGGLSELQQKKPGMMTLISLAISVAFIYSLLATFGLAAEELYWELATLVAIMLLGHWLEMSSIKGASGALQELANLLPDTAWLVTADGEKEVPIKTLQPGDKVLIRPGSQIPVDGTVLQGESYVNEAILTGESQPVHKHPGGRVIAGTFNEDGSLRIQVDKTAGNTTLAGILRLVRDAQSSHSQTQALADRAAFWLVIIAIGTALVTALAWVSAGAGTAFVMERVVTVLIIACPHALGLAIPLVIAISTTVAAQNGLLVKDRMALEEARLINCVVFDKTGTLTSGTLGLTGIYPLEDISQDELLKLAAAAESDSEHSVSRGILAAAREKALKPLTPSSFEALPGRGVKAVIEGKDVYVGGPNLLSYLNLDEARIEHPAAITKSGHGLIYVVVEGRVKGILALTDTVRQESKDAVRALKAQGVKVVMLTGDSAQAAKEVADELGIDQFFAGVLPEDKSGKIRQLKEEGYTVAMVGDGVNDAPALAVADVGIAIGAGTDIAVESAGIILVKNDPRDVARLLKLSRSVYGKMLQNLAWATGYNLLALPLAAGVLAPAGFILPMAVGAVVMSASTIIVAVNAQLLRRLNLSAGAPASGAVISSRKLPGMER
jgi:P-type Cu2+ transporter